MWGHVAGLILADHEDFFDIYLRVSMPAVFGAARGAGSAAKELQPMLQAVLVARVIEPGFKLAPHDAR